MAIKGTLSRVGNVDVQFISPDAFELIKTDALGVLKVSSGIFQELEGYKFFFKTTNDTIILKKYLPIKHIIMRRIAKACLALQIIGISAH